MSSILKLLAGAWSDVAGKRRAFVVGGYAVAAIARPLIRLAAAPWHVLALRAIDRVGKGRRTAPRDALIAETTAEGERGWAFGFHRQMDHLGAAIGPAIAFGFLWLGPGQLRLLFALALLPALPANIEFGAVYERLGPLAAFGMGTGMALAAALLLLGVTAPAAEARSSPRGESRNRRA